MSQVHPIAVTESALSERTSFEDPDALPFEPVFIMEVVSILGILIVAIALMVALDWVGFALFLG